MSKNAKRRLFSEGKLSRELIPQSTHLQVSNFLVVLHNWVWLEEQWLEKFPTTTDSSSFIRSSLTSKMKPAGVTFPETRGAWTLYFRWCWQHISILTSVQSPSTYRNNTSRTYRIPYCFGRLDKYNKSISQCCRLTFQNDTITPVSCFLRIIHLLVANGISCHLNEYQIKTKKYIGFKHCDHKVESRSIREILQYYFF